jgi:hypothetical protein
MRAQMAEAHFEPVQILPHLSDAESGGEAGER